MGLAIALQRARSSISLPQGRNAVPDLINTTRAHNYSMKSAVLKKSGNFFARKNVIVGEDAMFIELEETHDVETAYSRANFAFSRTCLPAFANPTGFCLRR